MPLFEKASNLTIYGGNFNDIHGDPATLEHMKKIHHDHERQKILAWVSAMEIYAKHLDVSNIRQPGTGEWLLNSKTFQAWERGTGQALWCAGIPGAGKTVLTSLIIDHLSILQRREPIGTIGVAWIYYNYKEESTQTPDALCLTLIRQLAAFSNKLYTHLQSLHKQEPRVGRPTPQYLFSDIRRLARAFSKAFIVVDALDECATDNRDKALAILSVLQSAGANILITSRNNASESIVNSDLVDLRRIDIRASTSDITKFVEARLVEQKRLNSIIRSQPLLRDEILSVILGSCDGMFLMAAFHVDSLGKHLNAGKVREALQCLPRTFPLLYQETMHRIENNDHANDALRVLSFLIHARRPLTLLELQHFLAVTPGDREFHDEYITDKDTLLSICGGLVVFDDKAGIVRLVHFTAQQYFDDVRASRFPGGDRDLGHACLAYLSFSTFKEISDLPSTLERHVLLEYIVHHWHKHVSDHQKVLIAPLMAFLKDIRLLQAYSHFTYAYHPLYFRHSAFIDSWERNNWGLARRYNQAGLHVAAATGLLHAAGQLIADGADVNARDITGRTPLLYASQRGDTHMVDLLVTN